MTADVLKGAAGGFLIGLVVALASTVTLWTGTDFPIMPSMGVPEAIVNVGILTIIGGAIGWSG